MTTKLERLLPQFYAEMHARGAFKGDSWEPHLFAFSEFLAAEDERARHTVLDFGCGPAGGLAATALFDHRVVPYDPYVEAYAADPWGRPLTAFFSCDVFEHLPLGALRDLLRRLCKHAGLAKVFVALATRHATKTLPNGLNAHLTVRPPEWWQGLFDGLLGPHFDTAFARADLAAGACVFAFNRRPPPADAEVKEDPDRADRQPLRGP